MTAALVMVCDPVAGLCVSSSCRCPWKPQCVKNNNNNNNILFTGFTARIGEERLPRRVMFGEMLGGTGYSGGQEWDWMKDLEEDLRAFGIKFEEWREAAQ